MKFREHRGQLAESMKTLIELPDKRALINHARLALEPYGFDVTEIVVHLYLDKPDERIGWDKTWLITIPGYGVFGFTDEEPT